MKQDRHSFHKLSYRKHEFHYSEYEQDAKKQVRAQSWKRTDTVDAWCRGRLMSALDPLLLAHPHASWVTIGDGRFGSDAHYINTKGGEALATDISDTLLKAALAEGYLTKAQKENAEALSFADDQFDFALCKDSFHHFPRPILALYEMLRVARIGVVLIEPLDEFADATVGQIIYRGLKELLFKLILRRKGQRFQYEVVGNFIYGVSKREIEKIAVALDYPAVVFKGINNYYVEGVEDELLIEKGPLYRRVRLMLLWRNLLSFLGLKAESVLVTVVLKKEPSKKLVSEFAKARFQLNSLPNNPYSE